MLLTHLRTEAGWNKAELARRANLCATQITQLELGRFVPPDDSTTLRKIADALGWKGEPRKLLQPAEMTHGSH